MRIKKIRIPRKLKKSRKKVKCIMDLSSLPEGWDIKKWMSFFVNEGVAFYRANSIKPEFKKL